MLVASGGKRLATMVPGLQMVRKPGDSFLKQSDDTPFPLCILARQMVAKRAQPSLELDLARCRPGRLIVGLSVDARCQFLKPRGDVRDLSQKRPVKLVEQGAERSGSRG